MAPILTSFSRSVVNDPCSTSRGHAVNFRFGSTTDSGGYLQFRPLMGVKRKSISSDWMSACSQEETLAVHTATALWHIAMPVLGAVRRIRRRHAVCFVFDFYRQLVNAFLSVSASHCCPWSFWEFLTVKRHISHCLRSNSLRRPKPSHLSWRMEFGAPIASPLDERDNASRQSRR